MTMAVSPTEHLKQGLEELQRLSIPNVSLDLLEPLGEFLSLLVKWNKVYNLTAVRDPLDMVDRHLMDSLIMSQWLPSITSSSDSTADVIDIGSGAGLPVLPLAIARPELSFVSIESNGKKTRFQQQCLTQLKLRNVSVINKRVQDVSLKSQLVVSRAFTAPAEFLSIAEPLCAKQGRVAIMLGRAERFPETLSSNFVVEEFVEVSVPGTESARHVAVCRRQ